MDTNRIDILGELISGGRYAGELQEKLPEIGASTLSSHLDVLEKAGLIVQEKSRGKILDNNALGGSRTTWQMRLQDRLKKTYYEPIFSAIAGAIKNDNGILGKTVALHIADGASVFCVTFLRLFNLW